MPFRYKTLDLIFPVVLLLALTAGAAAQTAQFNSNANFGAVAIGQTSSATTLTATFTSGATIGSATALTQGAPGLDFALTGTGTCKANQSYLAGDTCTVVATLTPLFAGARYGAVVLQDASGNTIASAYLEGVGSGPQAGFQPQQFSVRSFPYQGILPVRALAVDGNGNIFVGSSINGQYGTVMDEIPAGCEVPACVKKLAGSYGAPWGVAVDGAGNVFVADVGVSGRVFEILASGGYTTVRTLTGNFGTITSLAVDGNGNIFLSDNSSGAVEELLAAGGYSTVKTVASGFIGPDGITVDASGNVFVIQTQKVSEILAVGGSIPASPTVNTLASGFKSPIDIKVDASGNVFVTDSNSGHLGLFEILAAGGYTTVQTVFNGFTAPSGLAMDSGGNFYVVDNSSFGDFLNLVPRSTATGLNFQTPTPPGLTDTADGPLKATLSNLGNAPLNLSGLTFSNANFSFDSGSTTCTVTSVLAPGATCTVGVNFTPQASASTAVGTLTFTDNSLNQAGATQPVALSGTALITPAVSVTPAPSNVAVTQPLSVTVVVNGGSGKPTPTGTVVVTAVGFTSAAVTLSNGSATVNIPAGSLYVGTDTLHANYTPDTASASTYITALGAGIVTVTETAMIDPTVTLIPTSPATAVSQSLTITAAVSGGSGNPTPTGSIMLTVGGYTSPAVSLTNGSGSIVIPAGTLAIGTDQFLVVYTPDAASSTLYISHGQYGFITVTAAPPPAPTLSPGFGTVLIGQTSAAMPITLTFSGNATVGSVSALTQGAPGLDFALAAGGTCAAGATFTATQTCTVNVTFAPKFAGQRNGAVVVLDSVGKALATAYVHGTGSGPQLRFFAEPYYGYQHNLVNYPNDSTPLSTGFNHPNVGADGAGNIFVADWGNNQIKEIPAGCQQASCTTVRMSGIFAPSGVAVDGAGNLFVSTIGYSQVLEIPIGCQSPSCIVPLGGGFNQPYGVSVDASGNVFVADTFNNAVKELTAASGYSTILTLGSGYDVPWGVVVDTSGNLFVAEGGDQCDVFIPGSCTTINTSLVELTAASGYATTTILSSGGFGKPLGLTIDGGNNIYVADFGDSCANEFTAASAYASGSRLCGRTFSSFPEGLAVQSNGNVILPDVNNGTVTNLDFVAMPSIAFNTPTAAGQTDSVDSDQYVGFQNNGNLPLTFSAITFSDPAFTLDPGTTTCSTSTPLAAGSVCVIGVSFAPATTGSHNATVTLTDNNLNQSAATHVIQITADALPATPVILTNPANPTAVTSGTFTFSDMQAGVTFVCSIDSLPFSACASGIVYPGLSGGDHSFQVKAKDAIGALSLAAVYNWTVNAVAVVAPVITSGPGHVVNVNNGNATFTFTDTQAGVHYLCSLDGVAFTACTSGVSYTGLGQPGPSYSAVIYFHSFAVEAQDGSGNVSAVTSYPWTLTIDPVDAVPTDFGPVAVGQTSAARTVTFKFVFTTNPPEDNSTIAKIDATTLGVTGLDFAITDPGTCAVGTKASTGGTCSLQATFSPTYAGQRKGAVILLDASNNGIGWAYFSGTGTAPQVTFTPYTPVNYTILSPQNNADPNKNLITIASGSTVDGAGNLYVTDEAIASADQTISQSVGDIWEFPVGCATPACIKLINGGINPNNGLVLPTSLVMDGAGLLWAGNQALPPAQFSTVGTWTQSQFFFPFTFNSSYLATTVDGAGFATAEGSGILTLAGQQLGKQASGLSFDFSGTANSVAVDPQGNLFVADQGNNAVKEVLASSNYTISKIVGNGFNKPVSVASDTFGNIFVADAGNNAIKEMIASSGYTTILTIAPFNFGTATYGNSISVDAAGNLYVPNQANTLGQFVKLDFADAPALNFPTATLFGQKDTTDGTLTATVKNSGNAPLTISGLALSNNSFQLDADATTCSTAVPVAVGASCTVGVTFAPTAPGALTGTLTLTDNVRNVSGATQTFALSGTGYITPTTSTPTVVVTPGVSTLTTAQTLSVSVTVATASGHAVPTGTVSLSSGSYASSPVTLSGGTATFNVPSGVLATGNDTLTAIYAPDQAASATYNAGAGTASVSVTAPAKTTPTVTVTPSPATVTTAQGFTATISVTAGEGNSTPTGTVTLISGSYSSGAVVLVNGSATVAIPARSLPAGADTLMANYAPDFASGSNYNNATGSSTVQVQAIAKTAPVVTATPSASSITTAQSLSVTIALNGGIGNPVPTGTVTLSSGTYSSGPLTLSNGSIAITIPAGSLATGTDTLTANYTPDAAGATTYSTAAGTGTVTVQTIAKIAPVVTVTPTPSSITTAQTVSVTIALNGGTGNPVPTGTVTLSGGTYSSGPLTLNNGNAAVTIPAGSLATGTDTLTANYTPDTAGATTYSTASGTGTVVVTVPPPPPAPAILTNPANPTTATTATFTFSDSQSGVTFLCSLDGGAYATCSSGVSYSSIALGSHTFAVEAVAGENNASAATSFTWTINANTVQVSVGATPAGVAFSVDGTNYTLAQTLTWTVGSTHTIATTSPQTSNGTQNTFSSWSDGGAISHSVTAATGTTSYTASFSTSYLLTTAASPANAGTALPVTGTYYASGTVVNLSAAPSPGFTFVNWTGSVASANSASTTVTMSAPQTVTANFVAVQLPVAVLTPGTLTFTSVAGTTTAAQPATLQNTGNAALAITGISITGTNASSFAVATGTNACGSSLAAGATCNIYVTFTPASAASFTASLSVADNASGSPQATVLNGSGTVAPTFTVSSPTGAQTVQAGGKATYTITVTPQNGAFANSITLSASGLPAGATATFSPAGVTPGSTPASSTLTIQTTAVRARNDAPHWPFEAPVLAGLVILVLPAKRRRRIALLVLIFASLSGAAALTGCGGGFTVPATNYNITVTATSGAQQQTTTVHLTVQ